MIRAINLHKTFFVPESVKGPLGVIRGLISRRGHYVHAVRDISFDINPGEFVGYIGPNGAGKSTTIKMLTGILHPSAGEVEVCGLSPHKQRRQMVKNIGVVFGQRSQLWWDLPLIESYELLAAMYDVPEKVKKQMLAQFNDLLGLADYWDTPVRKLSLGQRMRGEICAALLHQPQVLFLDEPTIGLDVVAKNKIRGFLNHINQQGITILLTTHDLLDIEKLCSRVMVINQGALLQDGTMTDLWKALGGLTQLIVDFTAPVQVEAHCLKDLTYSFVNGQRLVISFDRSYVTANSLLRRIGSLGEIADIHIEEPDIETAIAKLF